MDPAEKNKVGSIRFSLMLDGLKCYSMCSGCF